MAGFVRRRLGALFFICALTFLLPGCSERTRDGKSARAGSIEFLIESAPASLDPRIGTDAQSEDLDGLLFNSLLARDGQMNVRPDLAERWEMPDALTYIFHLRRDVKFQDGSLLTSADVKFTFDSILSGAVASPKRGTFEMVQSVEAPDPYTVVFHLREPFASFPWNLTSPAIGIVPKGSGTDAGLRPIGTGPFQFVSMAQDEEIVLKRNANYFGKQADIEEIHFRIVPDAVVRALELRKGTADVAGMNSLTPDMADTLARESGIVAEQQPGTQLAYIAFNFEDSIVAHRQVRQALAVATNRETLIKYLLRGQARPAASLLPPDHWAYDSSVPHYDYDPVRAEKLLDAAGFPKGKNGVRFYLELKTSTEESTRLLGEALADEWKRVGVILNLRPLEFATFYSDITRGSFQMYAFRWVGANNDPDIFDYVFNSRRMPPEGANRGHYANAALDLLLERERVEANPSLRKGILSRVQEIVAEDEPYIDLWYPDNVCLHRDRIGRFRISPAGDYDFLASAEVK